MRILIIHPFGIGDVLMTTPVLTNLRKAYPDAYIAFMVNLRVKPLFEEDPRISRLYVYDRDYFNEDLWKHWSKLFWDIRREKFDIVLDFSLNSTFGFFCMMCGIPRRIGHDYRKRGRFLNEKIPFVGYATKSVKEYALDVLERLDVPTDHKTMEIVVGSQHQQWAKDWIKAQGIDPKQTLIAVVPGGGISWGRDAVHKRWPASQYASLVDKIIAKSKAAIILVGDKNEKPLVEEIARQCPYPLYDAVGSTSLLQMAALFQLCQVVILNDGGPMHVAVAVGAKTVAIFGPVDPKVYGHYLAGQHEIVWKNLPCQPCYRNFRRASCEHFSCLRDVSVDDVFKHIERLL